MWTRRSRFSRCTRRPRSATTQSMSNNAPPTVSLSHSDSYSHSHSHSSPSTQLHSAPPAPPPQSTTTSSPPEDQYQFTPLEQASKIIQDKLLKDDSWTAVGDRLGSEFGRLVGWDSFYCLYMETGRSQSLYCKSGHEIAFERTGRAQPKHASVRTNLVVVSRVFSTRLGG